MRKELVSIIVPMYNSERTISRLLRCLIHQSYNNIEILLINDGSTDKTLEICNQYAKNESRIKVFSKDNGGVSSARNCGIRNANGIYLTFIDADDYVNRDYISNLVKKAGENIVVVGSIKSIGIKEIKSKISKRTDIRVFQKNIFINWSVCNKLFHYNNIKLLQFSETLKIAEDLKFMCDLICNNKVHICYVCDAYYCYTNNFESAMHSRYCKGFLDAFLTEIDCYDKLKKHDFIGYNHVLIGNGAYQMMTRYFSQGREERTKTYLDYLNARRLIIDNKNVIKNNFGLGFKKKSLIYLSVYFPGLVILYKYFH